MRGKVPGMAEMTLEGVDARPEDSAFALGRVHSIEECEALGRLIAPWHNVVGLEMLPYHTMGVVKYEQLGIPYKLEGVPQMDTARMPELRNAVMAGMKKRRAELKNAIG